MALTVDRNGLRQPDSAPTSSEPGAPLLYRIEAAADLLGIGKTKLYELVPAGDLSTVKIGRATRVPLDSLEEYVARLRRSGTAA